MRWLTVFIVVCSFFWSFAQENKREITEDEVVVFESEEDVPIDNRIFEIFNVTKPAVFRSGDQDLQMFIAEHITYPKEALDSSKEGTVNLMFVIEKDGSVSGLKFMGRERGYGMEKEAIRVLQMTSGEWSPAYLGEMKVRMRQRIPISFRLD